MIPNVIHDEHSRNTYLVSNCYTAADVAPYLVYGTVLDNQKAVTVLGTFLQNAQYMDVFYREGYTDIEKEAGPTQTQVFTYNSRDYILSVNQRKNEVALYYGSLE